MLKGRLGAAFPLLVFHCVTSHVVSLTRHERPKLLDKFWDLHQRIIEVPNRKLRTKSANFKTNLMSLVACSVILLLTSSNVALPQV